MLPLQAKPRPLGSRISNMTDGKDRGEPPELLIARISCVPVDRGAFEASIFVHKW
jgi:hypothetical protein